MICEHSKRHFCCNLNSLKLTAKAPENGWLEIVYPFFRWPFCKSYISFRECSEISSQNLRICKKNDWVGSDIMASQPTDIAGLMRAWLNHWLPLIRPAIKLLFLRGVTLGEGWFIRHKHSGDLCEISLQNAGEWQKEGRIQQGCHKFCSLWVPEKTTT